MRNMSRVLSSGANSPPPSPPCRFFFTEYLFLHVMIGVYSAVCNMLPNVPLCTCKSGALFFAYSKAVATCVCCTTCVAPCRALPLEKGLNGQPVSLHPGFPLYYIHLGLIDNVICLHWFYESHSTSSLLRCKKKCETWMKEINPLMHSILICGWSVPCVRWF